MSVVFRAKCISPASRYDDNANVEIHDNKNDSHETNDLGEEVHFDNRIFESGNNKENTCEDGKMINKSNDEKQMEGMVASRQR